MGEKSKERPASADATSRSAAQALQDVARATTGVAGIDAILGGGLLRDRAYLVEGEHGSGKTTLRKLQLGADGIRIGEPLREFQGILTGTPRFTGTALPDIEEADAAN